MAEPSTPDVAWNDIVRFVRQLSHDLRNGLNAAELQAAYLAEIAETAEMKDEVKRLREMIAQVGGSLQQLTTKVAPPSPTLMSYRAADLVDDLKQKLDSLGNGAKVTWENSELNEAMLNIDPQLLQQAFLELFTNAFQHQPGQGPIIATSKIDNDRFMFTLREPKKSFEMSTENWGVEPLKNVGRSQYGLGLNRVRGIVEAHGGELSASYDQAASVLLTTVVLPLSKERPA
jgi:signal transduction histidine kinase